MGAWVTLHVFDHEKFQNELVPRLKGQKGDLEADYLCYLKTCVGHKSNLNIEQIINISRQFDDALSHFSGYPGKTNSEEFWDFFDWHYEYARFFTVMIFTHCADLYPYFRTGKTGIGGRMSYKRVSSLSEDILWSLYDYKHFSPHGMGITGWLNQEEMELLLLDFDNIYDDDYFEMRDEFEDFVKKLAAQKLSILQTIDVQQTELAKFYRKPKSVIFIGKINPGSIYAMNKTRANIKAYSTSSPLPIKRKSPLPPLAPVPTRP